MNILQEYVRNLDISYLYLTNISDVRNFLLNTTTTFSSDKDHTLSILEEQSDNTLSLYFRLYP